MSHAAALDASAPASAGRRLGIGAIALIVAVMLYVGLSVAAAATGIGRGGACEGPACGAGAHHPDQVLSPGGWSPPDASQLPGWDWVPPQGAIPRPDLAPFWVRVWHEMPYLDRYASNWMWEHGAYEVLPPSAGPDARLKTPEDWSTWSPGYSSES
jgi:hypothetical protein